MLSTSWKLRKVVGLRKHAGNVCYSSALTANPVSKERKPTVIDPDTSEFVPLDQVRYPAIRPEFPTSKWSYGSTSQKTAWEFQLRAESLHRQPTVFEKAQQFNLFEAKENFYDIVVPFTMPSALKFCQFLTRTHIFEQDVQPENTADKKEVVSNAKSGFAESVFAEVPENVIQLIAERAAPQVIQTLQRSAKDKNALQTVLQDVLDILVLTASASKQQIAANSQGGSSAKVVEEIERAQIGHSGRMQTFWRRSGFEQVPEVDLKKIISMSEYLKYVRKRIRDEFGHVRFTLQADAIWQMRSMLPTNPLFADRLFVAPDAAKGGSPVDASHPFASFWNAAREPVPRKTTPAYDPGLYFDLPQHDLHTFWHIHVQNFARLHQLPRLGRNVPAFWPRTPFWPGDPAEFPVLAAVQLDSTPFGNAYGDQRVAEVVQTNALLTAFGWCAAAAFNQGYTVYDELDYPISTFTVAYDCAPRRNIVSLCGFQLNALSALWKAADCGDPLNVASFSHVAPLFELDSTTQRVAVNQPIVKLLVAALLRGNIKARVDSSADLSPHVRQRSQVLPTFPFERTKAVEPDYAADVRNAAIDSDAATQESDKLPASQPDAAPTKVDKAQLQSADNAKASAAATPAEPETEANDVTYSFGTHDSCVGVPSRLWRTWINVKGEASFSRLNEPPAILKRRWTPRMHVNERYLARLSDPRDILFDVRRTYPRLKIPVRLLKIKNPEQKLGTKRFRENLELVKREVDEPYHKVILGDWTSRGRNN